MYFCSSCETLAYRTCLSHASYDDTLSGIVFLFCISLGNVSARFYRIIMYIAEQTSFASHDISTPLKYILWWTQKLSVWFLWPRWEKFAIQADGLHTGSHERVGSANHVHHKPEFFNIQSRKFARQAHILKSDPICQLVLGSIDQLWMVSPLYQGGDVSPHQGTHYTSFNFSAVN